MRVVVFILSLFLFCSSLQANEVWKKYELHREGIEISFPSEPSSINERKDTPQGEVTVESYSGQFLQREEYVTLQIIKYPIEYSNIKERRALLAGMVNGTLRGLQEGGLSPNLFHEEEKNIHGFPALLFGIDIKNEAQESQSFFWGLHVLRAQTVYSLIYTGENNLLNTNNFDVFIKSFAFNTLKEDLYKQLLEISNLTNKSLPKTIDKDTRLDTTTALPGNQFIYHYTLVNYRLEEIDPMEFKKEMTPLIVNGYNTSKDLKWFKKNKTTLIYKYRDVEGKEVTEIIIDPNAIYD